jgi:hypothetical protein
MYRIRQFLNSLEYNELLKLKKNLENGSFDIAKEISEKVKNREKRHGKTCSSCSNDLRHYGPNCYTLIFGAEDFKKKASFCGLDCLGYFITQLKELKEDDANAEKIE